MADKPFHELTKDEATDLAKGCVIGATSDEEIRSRLTEAGFNGKAAAICSMRSGPFFRAMVMVWGPRGEIISC